MRKVLGWGVFAVGVGALGLWGRGDHAQDMQAEITSAASAIVGSAVHGVTTEVSGRDITARGMADSEAEKATLLAALNEVEGRRVVHDEITVIPVVSPYRTEATFDGNTVSVSGAVPTETDRASIADVATGADAMTLANGEPADWTAASDAGLAALMDLEAGTLVLEDETLTLTGEAMTPDERDQAMAKLASVPGAFAQTVDITTIDDGTPFRLAVDYDGAAATGAGKLPSGLSIDDLAGDLGVEAIAGDTTTARIGEGAPFGAQARAGIAGLALLETGNLNLSPDANTLTGVALTPTEKAAAEAALDGQGITATISTIDDGQPFMLNATLADGAITGAGKLPMGVSLRNVSGDVMTAKIGEGAPVGDAARQGVAALAMLENGTLDVTETNVTLRGMATVPSVAADAEAALADLPAGFTKTVEIGTLDDGTPFRMTAALDNGAVSGEGKLPNGLVLPQVEGDFEISAIGAGDAFEGAAMAGLDGLRALERGTLEVTDTNVILRGDAADPTAAEAAKAALAALPATYAQQVDLTLLDDGLPVSYGVVFDPATGATLSGKVPTGFTTDAVADALGIDEVQANDVREARADGDASAAVAKLEQLSDWLPEMSGFALTADASDASAVAYAAPGVDAALLAANLDGVDVQPAANLPQDGATRINLLTGQEERFASVAWVPVLRFEADVSECRVRSEQVLTTGKVNFLVGSADLDAKSVRLINALAAIALTCTDREDLNLIIGGHTDSTGNADANLALSQRRADAVRSALIARGVSGDVMTAIGFGAAEPIATNDTDEGRAANRRTTFDWTIQQPAAQAAEQSTGE